MTRRAGNPGRALRPTALLVGEGYAEEHLLKWIRAVFTAGGQGRRITIKNSHGRGPDAIIRLGLDRDGFDEVAVLLDTDVSWPPECVAMAKEQGIVLIGCSPCLEAWLLRLAGYKVRDGIPSATHKAHFLRMFGRTANDQRVYPEFFGRDVLVAARSLDDGLDNLLKVFGA